MHTAVGANTHKGAIFSLGILCYAAGCCGEQAATDALLEKSAEVGSFFLDEMKQNTCCETGGEQQYQRYGLTGARGEAASGFRSVQTIAIPALREAIASGKSLQQAGLHALISLMSRVQDSNVIRRAGPDGQEFVIQQAQLALDGDCSEEMLRKMNCFFVQRGVSPGGSADLLAVTYFLHFLDTRRS